MEQQLPYAAARLTPEVIDLASDSNSSDDDESVSLQTQLQLPKSRRARKQTKFLGNMDVVGSQWSEVVAAEHTGHSLCPSTYPTLLSEANFGVQGAVLRKKRSHADAPGAAATLVRKRAHGSTAAADVVEVETETNGSGAVASRAAMRATPAGDDRQAVGTVHQMEPGEIDAEMVGWWRYCSREDETVASIAASFSADGWPDGWPTGGRRTDRDLPTVETILWANTSGLAGLDAHSKLRKRTFIYLLEGTDGDNTSDTDAELQCGFQCLTMGRDGQQGAVPHPKFAKWLGLTVCGECKNHLVSTSYEVEDDVEAGHPSDPWCTCCANRGQNLPVDLRECDGCSFVFCDQCCQQLQLECEGDSEWFCFQCEAFAGGSDNMIAKHFTSVEGKNSDMSCLQFSVESEPLPYREWFWPRLVQRIKKLVVDDSPPVMVGDTLDYCYSEPCYTFKGWWCYVRVKSVYQDDVTIEFLNHSSRSPGKLSSVEWKKLLGVHFSAPPKVYSSDTDESDDDDDDCVEGSSMQPSSIDEPSANGNRRKMTGKAGKASKTSKGAAEPNGQRPKRQRRAPPKPKRRWNDAGAHVAIGSTTAAEDTQPSEIPLGVDDNAAVQLILDTTAAISTGQTNADAEEATPSSQAQARQLFSKLSTLYRGNGRMIWHTADSIVPELCAQWNRHVEAVAHLHKFKLSEFRPLQLEAVTALVRLDLQKNVYCEWAGF